MLISTEQKNKVQASWETIMAEFFTKAVILRRFGSTRNAFGEEVKTSNTDIALTCLKKNASGLKDEMIRIQTSTTDREQLTLIFAVSVLENASTSLFTAGKCTIDKKDRFILDSNSYKILAIEEAGYFIDKFPIVKVKIEREQ